MIGATTDGMWVADRSKPDGDCGPTTLVDPTSGASTTLQPDLGAFCPERATGNERYVVWVNHSDTTADYIDWSLIAFDRTTGKRTTLASYPRTPDGKPVLGGFFYPQIHDSTVYWWAMTTRPGGPHPDVFAADLTTGKVTTLIEDAEWASLSYPYLYVTKFVTFDDLLTRTVHRMDLRDGTMTKLDLPGAPRYYCFTQDFGIVWLASERPETPPHDLTDRSMTVVVAPDGRLLRQETDDLAASGTLPPVWVTCGDHQAAWSNQDSGPWLLSVTVGKLARLGADGDGAWIGTTGSWVWWTEGRDEATVATRTATASQLLGRS